MAYRTKRVTLDSVTISTRVSVKEANQLARTARRAGQKVAAFVRALILSACQEAK